MAGFNMFVSEYSTLSLIIGWTYYWSSLKVKSGVYLSSLIIYILVLNLPLDIKHHSINHSQWSLHYISLCNVLFCFNDNYLVSAHLQICHIYIQFIGRKESYIKLYMLGNCFNSSLWNPKIRSTTTGMQQLFSKD